MSDPSMPKLCAICGKPVGKKKLVVITGGRPAHRACRPLASSGPRVSGAPAVHAPRQKELSRTEVLKRTGELRKQDAKKKPQPAKDLPRARRERRAETNRASSPVIPPQPYSGVEMKYIDGRWVQMHPESE